MNNRILMVLLASIVVTTLSGCCGPFRNFFFGRGARCGACNQPPAPMPGGATLPAPAQPRCNLPSLFHGRHQPDAGCGCNSGDCQTPQVVDSCGSGCGTTTSGYGSDPYSTTVIGNGVMGETIVEGQTLYGDQFVPAPTDSQGYRTNYAPSYDQSYKIDRDGLRIIQEDPMPPGARMIN